mgnify:CR=1 FL=1
MTIELDARADRGTVIAAPTATPTAPISIGRPGFQIALAGDDLAQTFPIVVRRETLREAQRARSLLRAGSHDQANFVVALEVEVAVAPDAADRDRRRVADLECRARAGPRSGAQRAPVGVHLVHQHLGRARSRGDAHRPNAVQRAPVDVGRLAHQLRVAAAGGPSDLDQPARVGAVGRADLRPSRSGAQPLRRR